LKGFIIFVFFLLLCSQVFPIGQHFFLVKIIDSSKDYAPESKVIFDIPTAVNFFSRAEMTKAILGSKARDLLKKWNKEFAGKKVSFSISSLLELT
jgi:hypothetical protein